MPIYKVASANSTYRVLAVVRIINDKLNKMEEITIYKFQLETIIEALRITSNIHESSKGETCHDRQVIQAYEYAKNALKNEKDVKVKYM